MSPDGRTIFVTGDDANDYGTVAYDASTGQERWASTYDYPGHDHYDFATSLAVKAPTAAWSSSRAAATAKRGYAYATIAYDAVDRRHALGDSLPRVGNDGGYARAIAVSPNGPRGLRGPGQMNVGCCARPDVPSPSAYDTTTAKKLWVETITAAEGTGYDEAAAITVSPDSGPVSCVHRSDMSSDTTIAYDARGPGAGSG